LRGLSAAGDSGVGARNEEFLYFVSAGLLGLISLRLEPWQAMGYTLGMKTAISLPDKVFREAEKMARKLKKSRSQLYREAIAEYLARHELESVTEAMNKVCLELGSSSDAFVKEAGRRVLARSEW